MTNSHFFSRHSSPDCAAGTLPGTLDSEDISNSGGDESLALGSFGIFHAMNIHHGSIPSASPCLLRSFAVNAIVVKGLYPFML